MAQLLSPVYTEPLKSNLSSISSWRMLPKTATPSNFVTHNGKRRGCGRVRVASEEKSFSTSDTVVVDDYYAVLGLVMYHTLIYFFSVYFPLKVFIHGKKKIIIIS